MFCKKKKKAKLFKKNILCLFFFVLLFFWVCNEIRAAIRKMKLGKATGPGSIIVELLEALEVYGIDKITTLLNKLNDTRHLKIHINFFFIARTPECDLDGMNNFMSHITKILLSTFIIKVGNKIKPEIGEEQCEG